MFNETSSVLVVLEILQKLQNAVHFISSLLHRYQSEGAVHGEPHEVSTSRFASTLIYICSVALGQRSLSSQFVYHTFMHPAGRDPGKLTTEKKCSLLCDLDS